MAYDGELDSGEVQAIKYLLEDGVPAVSSDKIHSIREVTADEDLQAAIDDEGADSYLRIHPGTYVADSFDVPYDNVTLEVMDGAVLKLTDAATNNQVVFPTGNNFSLIGEGTIDGNAPNNTAPNNGVRAYPGAARDGMHISGITITNCLNGGAVIVDYSNVTVDGCEFGGSDQMNNPVDVTAANTTSFGRVLITDNIIKGLNPTGSTDGIIVESDAGNTAHGEEGVITGNIFKGPWGTKQASNDFYYGIISHNNFRSLTVANNVMRAASADDSGSGINISHGGDDIAKDTSVTGNVLVGSGQTNHARGLMINNHENAVVTGNSVRRFDTTNQANGITTGLAAGNNVVVVGNNFDGSTNFDVDTTLTANNN